ncbi:MAG: outer membrane protein OmpA-like peptidoglycan-associated protein [Planctomycetota bacterium]|jgi:outer membrane protein OmpA-like peptidoglycan-associated protein/tetratricopeptide (TPR) repeat protein|uniref:OmpA family protein n=1 Tax=Patiriisocius sp. Uisw_047 TaxID=3230969 RepID=UPI0039E92E3A
MLKKPHNFLLFTLLTLLITSVSFSQENLIGKADKEFDKLAYMDAREIYLKVIKDGYESAEIYQRLGDTYYWNSDYENAAKWYSLLIEKFQGEARAIHYLRAAQSYKGIDKAQSHQFMIVYSEMTGDSLYDQNFKENKDGDYLSAIAFASKKYELEKTAINTETSDFGAAYYMDKLVFASDNGTTGDKIYPWTEQPYLDLFMADRGENGRLTNKQNLKGNINTEYHESSAVFTKDGSTIYFTRNNLIKGKTGKDKGKTVRLKLYTATKSAGGVWGNAVELPFNRAEYSTAHPALSLDEKRLYFSSDIPGPNAMGMSDLYYVTLLGENTYSTPVNLGPKVNTASRESFPFISVQGNLYFATDGRLGYGGYDIYSGTIDENSKMGTIQNVGIPANSERDDFALIINEDDQEGYLSSNRDGDTGSTNDDIYHIQLKFCEVEMTGVVVDDKTGALLPRALVVLIDTDNNKRLVETIADKDAVFSFPATECEKQYLVRATLDGYLPYEQIVLTTSKIIKLKLNIPLTAKDPCETGDLGCKLFLEPIYFDFDKSNIRPDAEIELAKILAALTLYPKLDIHIESHTDTRGKKSYNEALSERRAQSTLQWLVKKGVSIDRLTAQGYGESVLRIKCSNDVKCTEEEHQLNRRSMFIIQDNIPGIDNSQSQGE